MTPKTDSVAVLREKHVADLQFLRNDCGPDEPYAAALDAAIAALSAQGAEPVAWQFKDDDGKWCNFHSDKHRDDTIADGRWEVRALYTAPGGVGDAVTEEMVEAFAERFMQVRSIGMHRAWQSITEETRADYRKAFRAGLTAALAARTGQEEA